MPIRVSNGNKSLQHIRCVFLYYSVVFVMPAWRNISANLKQLWRHDDARVWRKRCWNRDVMMTLTRSVVRRNRDTSPTQNHCLAVTQYPRGRHGTSKCDVVVPSRARRVIPLDKEQALPVSPLQDIWWVRWDGQEDGCWPCRARLSFSVFGSSL